MHDAISKNNVEIAKLLIEHGADVNVTDILDNTPLDDAISKNNTEIAKLLIEYGADINVKGDYGKTPLHDAISKNNVEIAKLLIEHGADVNVKDYIGYTLLGYAVSNNNAEIVKLLIEHGANVNVKNNGDDTLLKSAIANEQTEIAKLLIEHGADINVKNYTGCTPLEIAITNKQTEMMKLLEHGADDTIDDIFGRTPENDADDTIDDIFGCMTDRGSKCVKPFENWINPPEYRQKWRKRACLIVIGIFAVPFFAEVLEGINNSFKATKAESFKAIKTLNCRDQAGTNGKVIGKIAGGHSVSCSKIEGEWCRTVCNGKKGFVYKKFLSK